MLDKLLGAVAPLITHLDSSAAVVLESISIGVVAPRNHANPRAVLLGAVESVSRSYVSLPSFVRS